MIRKINIAIVLLVGLLFQTAFSQSDTSIIFSEIMFNPVTTFSNNEFIELFNTSYTDTINLSGWKIRYATSPTDNITDAGSGTKLAPRQFAIIFEADYAGGYTIPTKALVLRIHDNFFGSSGMANTEARELKLINSKGDTTASYTYSVPNTTGYSDEKIIMIANNLATNWANSLVINGTPGGTNSVSPKEYDLAVTSIRFSPRAPVLNDTISISAMIKNLGLNAAQNFNVKFSYDIDGDSIPDVNLLPVSITNLNSKDSLLVNAPQKINKILNRVVAFCSIEFGQDENLSNNNLSVSIEPGLAPSSILINEFMFDPFAGEPEWIELYNNTEGTINLKNWKISDVLASPTLATITSSDFNFAPKSYLVITTDTNAIKNFYSNIPSRLLRVSIPALNNDKDGVVLYDHRSAVIDSVFYLSSWGIKGNSLERISLAESSTKQSNWVASFADSGGTPGQENSAKDAKNYPRNSFVVNEIMYDQLSGLSEYVEFLNTTSDTINIAGWRYIENGGLTLTLSSKLKKIPPGGFVILSADSSNLKHFTYLTEVSPDFHIAIANRSDLSLSNTEDMVKIIDLFGNTIDSVYYSSNWHNIESSIRNGRSLERFSQYNDSNDKNNWRSCTDSLGGTPAKENSIKYARSYPRNTLIVNEIMYDQLSGLSEYVEFLNTTSDTINVAGWRYIENGGLTLTLSSKLKKIPPGGFVILSADSSNLKHFTYLTELSSDNYITIANRSDLSLSNTEDMVKILDLFGNTIDSVFYSSKWHNSEIEDTKGRSLERINPLLSSTDSKNWSTSVNKLGGTPGKQNSIFTRTLPAKSSLDISPNPFSPDNDGFEDFTIFNYKLYQQTASIRIRIYDSQGRLVRTLADNEPSGAEGSIIFNGLDENKQPLRIGIYVVLLEAVNQTNGVVDKVKKALVVARKLK